MCKVSIIVPVYNSEKYLTRCLDSLISQTISDMEIIVINDGSTDNSNLILSRYAKNYSNLIRVFYQKNMGQAVARNYGISKASGEYIAFVDSDDYVENTTYQTAYDYAIKSNLDIVCFNFFEVRNNVKTHSHYYGGPKINDNVRKYILYETSPCNKIIKSNLLKENNIKFFENHIYEDFAVIPTLAKYTHKIGYINKYLYNYVIRENSTMRAKVFSPKLYDIYDVMDFLYNNFSNTPYTCELEFLYIEHLLHGASLRFLDYPECIKEIAKISTIMKSKFPHWKNNTYYKSQNIKYKIICNLLFYKHAKFVKFLLNKK